MTRPTAQRDADGDRGGDRGAVDAQPKCDHQEIAERDVQQIEEDLERQHVAHALAAQQPADDHIEDEIEGRGEHADSSSSGRRRRASAMPVLNMAKPSLPERHHQQDQREAEDDGEAERAQEGRALLALVAGADRPGRRSRRCPCAGS